MLFCYESLSEYIQPCYLLCHVPVHWPSGHSHHSFLPPCFLLNCHQPNPNDTSSKGHHLRRDCHYTSSAPALLAFWGQPMIIPRLAALCLLFRSVQWRNLPIMFLSRSGRNNLWGPYLLNKKKWRWTSLATEPAGFQGLDSHVNVPCPWASSFCHFSEESCHAYICLRFLLRRYGTGGNGGLQYLEWVLIPMASL